MNVRTYPITTKLKPNGIEEKGNRQEQKESRKGMKDSFRVSLSSLSSDSLLVMMSLVF
ncbi:hypothetical protein Hanom_Chr13g01187521 [Helianthus anomalus]